MTKKIAYENPICMRCDTPLELVEVMDYYENYEDSEVEPREYKCPHCGAIHMVYPVAEEDKNEYVFYNDEAEDTLGGSSHGYEGLCPICGSHIVWGADFMRSEVLGDCEYDDDDSLASNVFCPHCGASIDIIEAKPSEYHLYPAYEEYDKSNKEND